MIYFDNAATSFPKPPMVFEAMQQFMCDLGGNPGRSGHRLATGAEAMVEQARNVLSKFFGLQDPRRCIFTLNCTDALNMAIEGLLRNGDHAITSVLEHNSVNRPLQMLHDGGTIGLTRVGANAAGVWEVDAVLDAIRPETRLIVLTQVSNVIGAICPVEELGKALRERYPQVLFLVDAAQGAGIIELDMETNGIDLLAFPGHKALFGPPGTGALLLGSRVKEDRLNTWRVGGTGGDSSSPHQPLELPYRLEGGTPNTMGIRGLLAGVQFVQALGKGAVLRHEQDLLKQLIDGFDSERFKLYGTRDASRKAGVLSLSIEGHDAAEVATILDQAFEICVRPGLHCSPYTHKAMGTFASGGTVRLSPGYLNTSEEVEQVLGALREIAN